METTKHILSAYSIFLVHMERVTNSVYRIHDGQHIYALKRSSLTKDTIENWESVLHTAHAYNLSGIAPVYLTKSKKMYCEVEGVYYYLMPWIEQSESSIEQLYRSIGKIHAKTKQTQSINLNNILPQFNTYKEYCKQSMQNLLNYVDKFEQVRYMSPFELQVCTHFRDMEIIIKQSINRTEKFITQLTEEKTWNYSLCHGYLNQSHVLNRTIINWEKAKYDHPITDLVFLFKNDMIVYDTSEKLFINLFTNYMDVNKLTRAELYLLTIYLVDPTEYMTSVQQYIEAINQVSMINQVKELQSIYRKLLIGLEWLNYIEQEFEFPTFEEKEN